MTETQITSSIFLIFGLLTLYGIIKNKKVLSIVALLICISSSVLGNILLNIGNSGSSTFAVKSLVVAA